MSKKGIIFSDVDGCLTFHGELHGIKKTGENDDGTVRVIDPKEGTEHDAHDLSKKFYNIYFDVETRRLGHILHEDYDIVLVSGARKSDMDYRKSFIDFADGYILENGGLILGQAYEADQEWEEMLKDEVPYLNVALRNLESLGWVVDSKDRITSLRVRLKDNPNRTEDELAQLAEDLILHRKLKMTKSIGSLDIILASAGKGNAVNYLMQKMGYDQSQSIGIGDDINDLDLLEQCAVNCVLRSSHPKVIEAAKAEGWYISSNLHFNGINEIFRHIDSINK